MAERIAKPTTYQAAVLEQITKLRGEDASEGYQPLFMKLKGIEDKLGEPPLWVLAFGEKPVEPESRDMFEITFVENDMLSEEEQLTLKHNGLDIEREMLIDHTGNEALVERIYGVKVDGRYKDSRKSRSLLRVTIMLEFNGSRLFMSLLPDDPDYWWFDVVDTTDFPRDLLTMKGLIPSYIKEFRHHEDSLVS